MKIVFRHRVSELLADQSDFKPYKIIIQSAFLYNDDINDDLLFPKEFYEKLLKVYKNMLHDTVCSEIVVQHSKSGD